MAYRLPTEAEWEWAARGGEAFLYAGSNDLDVVAWHRGNSGGGRHAVAGKRANRFGLSDMTGNVWEWTADWAGDYPTGSVTDPTGPAYGSNRVLRGGSWYDVASITRVAYRRNFDPGVRFYNFGFRLLRSLP